MDIFIANLDSRLTRDQLKHSLTPILQQVKIEVFDLRKRNDKTFAHLTVADIAKAQALLAYAKQNLYLLKSPSGRFAKFDVNRHPTDPQLLKVLQKEEKDRVARKGWHDSVGHHGSANHGDKHEGSLSFLSLECGRWETVTGQAVFVPYHVSRGRGVLSRNGKALVLTMDTDAYPSFDLLVDLYNIQSLALSNIGAVRTLTLALNMAPKILEKVKIDSEDILADMLRAMGTVTFTQKPILKHRVSSYQHADQEIFGSCLSYRMAFNQNIEGFKNTIQRMTSSQIPISRVRELSNQGTLRSFKAQVLKLDQAVKMSQCFFGWRFQIQAFWTNSLLSPGEVQRMIPAMAELRKRSGDIALVRVLQRVIQQLSIPDASTKTLTSGFQGAMQAMQQQEGFVVGDVAPQVLKRDEVSVYRAVVTPTGVYLSGPEPVAANRILRQYRAHEDCFLRVVFSDENEGRLEFDRDYSNEKILQGRFLTILRKGLDVAGEHFDFLGFSHSSLRSQTCWFMRSFVHEGHLLFAKNLIAQLGDFSTIHCPAKCAARIGQAFSETTAAIRIDPSIVTVMPDVKVGTYMFTDGCGTMSTKAWRLLKGTSSSKQQPTSYQIRYKGVKGMLSLDSRLQGFQVRLRESMVKFTGSPSNEIEICGTNGRPLPFKLNRPLIKILEDLGVPLSVFEKLQEQAIRILSQSARSTKSAIDFLSARLSDGNTGLPTLLKCLQQIGIDVTEDGFLREILGALLQVQLREIKYRSRILVPNALTLYGISDETGWLGPNEVFVTFASEDFKSHLHLNGRVAVTRSPAMHPGDIQLVQAVVPPESSSLWSLHNCVVFSRKGERDVPSMLSGGDLDGDLYNIIYDDDLMPKKTAQPAAYLPAQPVDIGRSVTTDDMTGFFIDFMQNDQLGRISSLHQAFADQMEHGTSSPECLLLAGLHSTAVDFSKSGVPVDVKKIPRAPLYRPDFMAPSASTKVEKGIKRVAELPEPEGNQRYRYYESDRVLGKLYRAVDEDIFFRDLEDDLSSIFSREATNTVLGEIQEWVMAQLDPAEIYEYLQTAAEVRNYYEATIQDIMSRYGIHRNDPLTEKEVFTGNILGRSGATSRYQREQSDYMKSIFNWELRDLKAWMVDRTNQDEDKFVYLAAACLCHAVDKKSSVDEGLSSFGWVMAAMCVPALFERTEEVVSSG